MMRRLIVSSGLTTGACSIVFLLASPLKMINLLSEGALPLSSYLLGMLALLPMILTVATPLGTATGVIYCYYIWIERNEIVAFRAGGASTFSIALPGVIAGIAGMIFTGAMSLYFLPIGFRSFEDIRFRAIHNRTFDSLQEGFNHLEPGLTIFFQKRLSADSIENVIIIDERTPDVLVGQSAERGEFLVLRDGTPVVLLEHGERFSGSHADGTEHKVLFDSFMVSLRRNDAEVDIRSWRGFFEESLMHLLRPPAETKQTAAEAAVWGAEAHRRIVSPFLSLGYVLFSVGLLLRGRNPRVGSSIRPIAVLVAVMAWHIVIYLGHAAVSYAPELTIQYYLLGLSPVIAGIGLLLCGDSRCWSHRPSRGTSVQD